MRTVRLTALSGLLAVFVVASPQPASANPAAAALKLNHASTADLIQVGRYYNRRRYYGRPYYRSYRYRRPYYGRPYRYYGRPYYYRRPYYRPYRYYGRPYRYRRPGVSVWIGL